MQEQYKSGDRVKHASRTDWGLGEVLSDQCAGRVSVLFEDAGEKNFEIDKAKFIKVSGDEAQSDYLTARARVARGRLTEPTKTKNGHAASITFPQAIDNFLSFFPEGFQDAEYLSEGGNGERVYKEVACQLMAELLNRSTFNALLEQGEYHEIIIRAKRVMNKTNLIHQYEKIWFTNGVATEENQELFSTSLFDLLYGENKIQVRFEGFSEMLYQIKAAKWTIATYFLYITHPEQHIFLKPEVTKSCAATLGMEINYKPELNWLTYSRVLELAALIKAKLVKDGRQILVPRDMIDIQSFLWITAPGYFQ